MRVGSACRRRHTTPAAATCTICSHASQPRKIGAVIGAMPASESSVYADGIRTQRDVTVRVRVSGPSGI